MDLAYFELLKQFLAGLIFLLACFFSACCITEKNKGDQYSLNTSNTLAIKLAFIVLLVVVIFSLFKTKFNSVNLACCIIFIYFFINRQVYKNYKLTLSLSDKKFNLLLYLFGIYIFWFLFILFSLKVDLSLNYVRSPQRDLLYYINLTKQLVNHGREDTVVMIDNSSGTGRSAYHYFELWFNGFIGQTFNLDYYKSFIVTTRVLLLSLISFLFFSVCTLINNSRSNKLILFSPLLLLLKPILFFGFSNLKGFIDYYLFDPREEVYFLFLLIEIYFYLKWRKLSLIGFSLLIVATITTLPSIFSFIFIILLLKIFLKVRFVDYRNLILFFLTFLFIFLYYKIINKTSGKGPTDFSVLDYIHQINFRTSLNIFIGNLLYFFIVSLPFLIILILIIVINKISVLNFLKKFIVINNNLFVILLSLIVVSNVTYSLLYILTDSNQLFLNLSMTLSVLLYSLILVHLFTHYNLTRINFSLGLIFLLISGCSIKSLYGAIDFSNEEKISKSFFNEIHKKYKEGKLNNGVSFPSTNFYGMIQNWNDKLTWLGQYIYYFNPTIKAVNIDIDSTRMDKNDLVQRAWQNKLLRTSYLHNFIENYHKSYNSNLRKEEYQLKYIEKNNVDFIIVDPNNELPNNIGSKVKDSLLDSYSGQKIYFLK